MPEFTDDASGSDPYKNFRFRVTWDGRHVAGFSKAEVLKRTTEVVEFRTGGDPSSRKSPGRGEYEAITLERGVTRDPEFQQWVRNAGAAPPAEDLTLELYDEAGRLTIAYRLYRCWVSEYQAVPELDANANVVAIRTMTLAMQGWERVEP